MTNNDYRIDEFLRKIQYLSTNRTIDEKQIYIQLVNNGINYDEQRAKNDTIIAKLLDKYKKNRKVKLSSNQSYYSISSQDYPSSINPIKISVPLKQDNLDNNADRILTYIQKHNIKHNSRISKINRIDNLVIKVYNPTDADNIINFINTNKHLKNQMYEVNPFYITYGNITLSMDRNLSYNEILSTYINSYVSLCNSNYKQVNYEDFKEYIVSKYHRLISKQELSEFINFPNPYNLSNSELLSNIKEVTEVIISSLSHQNKDDLFNYFNTVNNPTYQGASEFKEFDDIYNNSELLDEIITTMIEKYGYEYTYDSLMKYRNMGPITNITRKNNLRDTVTESTTFRTYVNLINLEAILEHHKPKQEVKKTAKEELKDTKELLLEQICRETYMAFQTKDRHYSGNLQVSHSLENMENGLYSTITRTNNARELASSYIDAKDVKNLVTSTLEKNGYIIEDEDIYELYANHIEHLCTNNIKRGRK